MDSRRGDLRTDGYWQDGGTNWVIRVLCVGGSVLYLFTFLEPISKTDFWKELFLSTVSIEKNGMHDVLNFQ